MFLLSFLIILVPVYSALSISTWVIDTLSHNYGDNYSNTVDCVYPIIPISAKPNLYLRCYINLEPNLFTNQSFISRDKFAAISSLHAATIIVPSGISVFSINNSN